MSDPRAAKPDRATAPGREEWTRPSLRRLPLSGAESATVVTVDLAEQTS
jgi:hypothetical protein